MTDEEKQLDQLAQEIAADTSKDAPAQPDGTESTNVAADSTVTDGDKVEDSAVLKTQLAEAKANLAKIEMERNLLRNKQKEADRKALDTVDKTKLDDLTAAYDNLLAEKDEREAKEAEETSRKTANEFRDSIIAQRDAKVQAVAKALISKNENNLAWSDAKNEDDAAAQLNAQLDTLAGVLGIEPTVTPPNPQVHPNNPGNPTTDVPFEEMTLEQMEKSLPHAPAR